MESDEQLQLIRKMVITRDDILTQHAPWFKDMDDDDDDDHDDDERFSYDKSPSQNAPYKTAILQCYSEKTGFDDFEREQLQEVFSKDENKNFEKVPIICKAFSMDNLQFTCSASEVVHIIGHNVGDNGFNYTQVRKRESMHAYLFVLFNLLGEMLCIDVYS